MRCAKGGQAHGPAVPTMVRDIAASDETSFTVSDDVQGVEFVSLAETLHLVRNGPRHLVDGPRVEARQHAAELKGHDCVPVPSQPPFHGRPDISGLKESMKKQHDLLAAPVIVVLGGRVGPEVDGPHTSELGA